MPTHRFRWSLVAPLLVLAGLFAMHGLGHRVGPHAGAHAGTDAGVQATTHVAQHAAMAPTAGLPAYAPVSDGLTPGAATVLCVAILLGGLVAWLVLVAGRRRAPWSLPRQAPPAAPVPRSRAPDPPSPSLLSVYRC